MTTPGTHHPQHTLLTTARILVIDDEAMVRALIVRALLDEGYEVIAAAGGEAALDLALGTKVDLVVTNSWLRDMSGVDAIAQLAKHFPDIPILHIDDIPRSKRSFSGESMPEDVPVLYKPFSITAIKAAVRELVGGAAGRKGGGREGRTE
jgi:two-component system OmpR family response regulator